MLQGKSISLLESFKGRVVRSDNDGQKKMTRSVWDDRYGRTEGMAAECGIAPSMQRQAVAQQYRVNIPAATPQQY